MARLVAVKVAAGLCTPTRRYQKKKTKSPAEVEGWPTVAVGALRRPMGCAVAARAAAGKMFSIGVSACRDYLVAGVTADF